MTTFGYSSNLRYVFILFVSTVTIFYVLAEIPDDLSAINVYETADGYPVFLGTKVGAKNKTDQLQDFQGMKKIGNNFYIYAREAIYVVSAQPRILMENASAVIPYKQEVKWPASDDALRLCKLKGKSKTNCRSYIKLLQEDVLPDSKDGVEKKIIICSTNAFSPESRIYDLLADGDLVYTGRHYDGKLNCPYSPKQKSISILSDRNLYTATVSGFSGEDPLLMRSSRNSSSINLRTPRENAIFNDPTFIRFIDVSSPANKILIFFSEVAIEDQTNKIVTRVGQACKNDEGGKNLLRSEFSSFFKARLDCSLPGKPPFYFNEMSDVTSLVSLDSEYKIGSKKMVFALMNTPRNSIPASAICAFMLDDIENTLSGPFMEKYRMESTGKVYWEKQETYPHPHLAGCERSPNDLNDNNLNFIKKHPLMYDSVPAWSFLLQTHATSSPLFTRTRERNFLTTLNVDVESGIFSNFTVFIAGTEDGKILKILLLSSGKSVLVEQRIVFNAEKCNGSKTVRQIILDKNSGSMMVAFENCVVNASLCPLLESNCPRTCIESRDPYCAFDGVKCITVSSQKQDNARLRQDLNYGNVDDMHPCSPLLHGDSNQPDDSDDELSLEISSNDSEILNDIKATTVPPAITKFSKQAKASPYFVAAGCFFLGILCGVLAMYLWKKKCHQSKKGSFEEMELSRSKEMKNTNTNENQKRSSQYSSKSIQRQDSNNSRSNQRNSGPQLANADPASRKRTTTENSGRNDDGIIASDNHQRPSMTPKVAQHLSTASTGGGKHVARQSRPSVNSVPDQQEFSPDSSDRYPSAGSDQNLEDPFSDDANDESKQRSSVNPRIDQNYYSQVLPPSSEKKGRLPPHRSQSMQGSYHFQPSTMDPRLRGFSRQLSFAPNGTASFANYPPQFLASSQPSPNKNFRSAQPLPVDLNGTPKRGFENGVKDYTRSLDRPRKPGARKYTTPMQGPYDEQGKQIYSSKSISTRRRGASESEKPNKGFMYRPPVHHRISEEEETPFLDHHNLQKPKLKLDLSQSRILNGSHHSPYSGGGASPSIRLNANGQPLFNNGHSNPGTPSREGTVRFVPKQLSIPESRNPTVNEVHPSLSNPSSPLTEAPPSTFPAPERVRHPSGKMIISQQSTPLLQQAPPDLQQDPAFYSPNKYPRPRHFSGGVAVQPPPHSPNEERDVIQIFREPNRAQTVNAIGYA